jgi:hypothetical protein
VGAATVLSYAVIADYFPVEIAARANGALNLLHFGWAFTVQYGIGLIVNQWAPQDGHYPLDAYQTAFGVSLALQFAALLWFAVPWLRSFVRFIFVPADSRAVLAPAAVAEESALESSEGIEW